MATAQQQVQQEVNRQAQRVQLVRYDPRQSVGGTPSTPAATEDPPATSDEEQEPAASAGDPLLATGLRKQEILLTFEGGYGNIQAVLQPLVVAHDLKLEGRPLQKTSPHQPGLQPSA